MSLFKQLMGTKTSSPNSQRAAKVINAKQFLGKEEGPKYFDPEEFGNYGLSLRDEEAQQLEEVVDFALSGYPLVGALIKRTDKGGKPYVMANFQVTRGSNVALKVVLEQNMLQFLKDLQQGKITINFSLAELIETALNN